MSTCAHDHCRDDELSDLAWSIRRLWHAIVSDPAHTEALAGLHPQQYWVLGVLRGGPKRMSELAAITSTSSANMTGLIDRLAERGLIERVRSESDRRVVDVAITEEGVEQMRRFRADFCGRVARVMEPLTEEEQATLARLLGKALGPRSAERPACGSDDTTRNEE